MSQTGPALPSVRPSPGSESLAGCWQISREADDRTSVERAAETGRLGHGVWCPLVRSWELTTGHLHYTAVTSLHIVVSYNSPDHSLFHLALEYKVFYC